jgi:predicted transcriptional regulator
MKKNRVDIRAGSTDEFFSRVRNHAAKLDRGESIIAPRISITFEDPLEMLNVLTSERVRLLRKAKAGALPILDLA